jgi:hypothetical protein
MTGSSTATPGLQPWDVAPYVTLVILIGGTVYRHKYDRFSAGRRAPRS